MLELKLIHVIVKGCHQRTNKYSVSDIGFIMVHSLNESRTAIRQQAITWNNVD